MVGRLRIGRSPLTRASISYTNSVSQPFPDFFLFSETALVGFLTTLLIEKHTRTKTILCYNEDWDPPFGTHFCFAIGSNKIFLGRLRDPCTNDRSKIECYGKGLTPGCSTNRWFRWWAPSIGRLKYETVVYLISGNHLSWTSATDIQYILY